MSPFIQVLLYAKAYRLRIAAATICSILNTIFDVLPEILIGIAVNVVVKGQHSLLASFGVTDIKKQLLLLGFATFIVWALESIFQYAYVFLWRTTAQAVQHDMRVDAYTHMQNLPMSYYEEKPTGSILSILNDDINQLERFLDNGVNQFIYLVTSSLISAALFLYISPQLALFVLLPLPIIFFMSFFFQRKISLRYNSVRESAGDVAARLVNNISGIATIKSYTSQRYERARLEKDSQEYLQANRSVIRLTAAFIPLVRMAIVFGFICTLVLGGWQVVDGILDVGSYSLLVFQTQRLLWPFTELGHIADLYERAMASGRRILDLLQEPIETSPGQRRLNIHEIKGALRFDNVTFVYPNGMHIFDNLSLEIKAGSTVAFVGTTGSGKSTLIKLLLRFYEPTTGKILLDGIDINTIHLNDLRRAIGLVSQDVFLFQGTVRENIAYGSFDASFEEIVRAAKIAEAHDFIVTLPDGYETTIGERGIKLSGGQRQRLSIARAVLKGSPLLIFDEATSAVDNETEIAIQRSLEKITVHHTVIMIAHRLSTIRNADVIFVMGEGAIVESGTHDQLLALGSVYAQLWNVQTGAK